MRNIPQRCSNPTNLMLPKPIGECTGILRIIESEPIGYCEFPTPEAGWRAAHRQIVLDQVRNLTLKQFIFKFAPPGENDTNEYLDFVISELHVPPDVPLSQLSKYALAGVMAKMEGYYEEER